MEMTSTRSRQNKSVLTLRVNYRPVTGKYKERSMHTHEPSWVGLVSPDLAINQHMALHQDRNDLTVRQGILEPVPDDEDKGEALPRLVGTRGWLGCLLIATFQTSVPR
jgi:hypothetical protein